MEQLHLTRNNNIPVNQIHEIVFWMKLNASGCRHLLTTTCTGTTITTATTSTTSQTEEEDNNDDKNKTNTKISSSSGGGGGGDGGYFLSVCQIILNKLASIDDPSCLYYFLNRKPEIFSSFFVTCVQIKRKKDT